MLESISVNELLITITALAGAIGVIARVIKYPLSLRRKVEDIEEELKESKELNRMLLEALIVLLDDDKDDDAHRLKKNEVRTQINRYLISR